ncbi:MAG: carboxymuconolactone decarboxylase family protein [Rhodocyclaceae bacterium]|nr:carboxymuconolactone decarboxylase family protein [Rhodocyclaceae bacterium]
MTTEPRIAPLSEPLPLAVAAAMAKLIPPGMPAPKLFLTTARNEGLFTHMVNTGMIGPTGLMDRRSLPPRLRELVILRTCVANGCDYEFNLHVQTISERMGLSKAEIDDVRRAEPSADSWTAAEIAVMALVDGLVARREVTDDGFAAARRHHDEATLIEVVHLIGLYSGVAMMVALARPQFDRYRPGPVQLASPSAGATAR